MPTRTTSYRVSRVSADKRPAWRRMLSNRKHQSNTSQSGKSTQLENILESASFEHHPEDIYADVSVAEGIMTGHSSHNRVRQSPGYHTSTGVIAPPAITRERSPPLPPLPPRTRSHTSNPSSEVPSSGSTSRSSRRHRGPRPIIVMVDSDGEVITLGEGSQTSSRSGRSKGSHSGSSGVSYYVIPEGYPVIFEDEDGNELTRVGDFDGVPKDARDTRPLYDQPKAASVDRSRGYSLPNYHRPSHFRSDDESTSQYGHRSPSRSTSAPKVVYLDQGRHHEYKDYSGRSRAYSSSGSSSSDREHTHHRDHHSTYDRYRDHNPSSSRSRHHDHGRARSGDHDRVTRLLYVDDTPDTADVSHMRDGAIKDETSTPSEHRSRESRSESYPHSSRRRDDRYYASSGDGDRTHHFRDDHLYTRRREHYR